ncbi:hypothetical protein EJ08DRAFT_735729 [Tothia fuscella]|uniref:Uncharacterized protein n=1 Tax=Tothia fuscella TaxID=1048955 RepID=A0A9P4NNR8_9PEZI|nr:hypothetical protein EJ08DRAFT_735729 [Tothia fuscella]
MSDPSNMSRSTNGSNGVKCSNPEQGFQYTMPPLPYPKDFWFRKESRSKDIFDKQEVEKAARQTSKEAVVHSFIPSVEPIVSPAEAVRRAFKEAVFKSLATSGKPAVPSTQPKST